MKPVEIRELSEDELSQRIDEAKEELFNLRFQLATGQLDNAMKIRDARRLIAQLKTVERERVLASEKADEQVG